MQKTGRFTMNFGSGITTNLEDPETVTASFNTLGMPIGSTSDYDGGFTYVASTTYDPTGRITGRTMGGTGSTYGLTRTYTYQTSDGAITNLTANSITPLTSPTPTTTLIQNDTYTYDPAGNPTRIRHNPVGTTNDETECFQYDTRQRLTRGYTLAGGNATCTPPTTPTGPAPYDESYTFTTLDQFDSNGDTGNTRQYDTAGSTVTGCTTNTNTTKPHATSYITAPGSTSTNSGHEYTYDCNGSTTQDIDHTTNTTTDHTWDTHNRLQTSIITQPGQPAITQTDTYDAGGQRALRTVAVTGGATIKTITIGELRYDWTSSGPGTVNVVRSYSGAQRGDPIAGGDTCTWSATDRHGSLVSNVSNVSGALPILRYTPYGGVRAGGLFNDHGFLGEVVDPVTGLSYLHNRYHDPVLGAFVSVDPLVQATSDPFVYAGGNPTTYTDPSGLCREGDGVCGVDFTGSGRLIDGRAACKLLTGNSSCTSSTQDSKGEELTLTITPDDSLRMLSLIAALGNSVSPPDPEHLVSDGWPAGGGVCVSDQTFAFVGLEGAICMVFTKNDFGVTVTTEYQNGAGLTASIEGGVLFTNADEVSDTYGQSYCLGGGGGIEVSVSFEICFGMDPDESSGGGGPNFTGVWTVFIGGGIGVGAGAWQGFAYTSELSLSSVSSFGCMLVGCLF